MGKTAGTFARLGVVAACLAAAACAGPGAPKTTGTAARRMSTIHVGTARPCPSAPDDVFGSAFVIGSTSQSIEEIHDGRSMAPRNLRPADGFVNDRISKVGRPGG